MTYARDNLLVFRDFLQGHTVIYGHYHGHYREFILGHLSLP